MKRNSTIPNSMQMLELLQNPYYIIDKDFRIRYFSQNENRFSQADYIGEICYLALTNENQPCPGCPALHLLSSNQTKAQSYFDNPRINRKWLTTAVPIKWDNQDMYLIYCHDLDEKIAIDNTPAWRELLNSTVSNGLIGVYDEPGFPIYYINDLLLNYLDYPTKESMLAACGGLLVNCIHPSDKNKATEEVVQNLSERNKFSHVICRMRKRDNSYIWLDSTGRREILPDGKMGIFSSLIDITKLVNAEATAKEKESSMQAAIQHSNLDFVEYNIIENSAIVTYNSSQESAPIRYNIEDFPNALISNGKIYKDDIPKFLDVIKKIKSGNSYAECDINVSLHNDEGFTWRRMRFTVVQYIDEQPSKAIGTFQNIEPWKQLETRFQQTILQNGIITLELHAQSKKIHRIDGVSELFRQIKSINSESTVDIFTSGDIPTIHIDDQPLFFSALNKACDGENFPRCTLRIYYYEECQYLWSDLILTPIGTPNTTPGRILVTCKKNHSEKLVQMHYNEERQLRQNLKSNVLASSIHNITRHEVEDFWLKGTSIMQDSYRFLTRYSERCEILLAEAKLSKEQKDHFSEEYLMEQYRNGVNSISEEYWGVTFGDNPKDIYVHVDCHLFQRQETKDIIAVYYSSDYTKEHITKKVFEVAAATDYDYVGVIYCRTETTNSITSNSSLFEYMQWSNDYSTQLRNFSKKLAPPNAEKFWFDNFLKKASIDTIRRELEKNPVYNSGIFECQDPNLGLRKKEFHYTYADKETEIIVCTLSDFTETLKYETEKNRQLDNALQAAEKANNAKSEFLSTISHEIRTPMNVIIGLTELALQDADNEDTVRNYLTKSQVAERHLLSLINNILDMSKIEAGQFIPHLEKYGYPEFREYINAVIRPLCREKSITLIEEVQPTTLPIITDKLRFNQIFFNIFSNAIKFTPSGGMIHFRHYYHIERSIMHATFEIKDNGIGMSKEFQQKMFNPFTQESTNYDRSLQGSGLGLSLVKTFVTSLGGQITCVSEKSKGTLIRLKFTFELANDSDTKPESIPDTDMLDLNGKTFLVAEDHQVNLLIINKLLTSKGATIIPAENGLQALEQFENSPINSVDFILMDIRMPIMSGLDATMAIRSLNRPDAKTVPIVAMTANAYDEDRQSSLNAGMDYHLSKPIEIRDLYQTIYRFLK